MVLKAGKVLLVLFVVVVAIVGGSYVNSSARAASPCFRTDQAAWKAYDQVMKTPHHGKEAKRTARTLVRQAIRRDVVACQAQ